MHTRHSSLEQRYARAHVDARRVGAGDGRTTLRQPGPHQGLQDEAAEDVSHSKHGQDLLYLGGGLGRLMRGAHRGHTLRSSAHEGSLASPYSTFWHMSMLPSAVGSR